MELSEKYVLISRLDDGRKRKFGEIFLGRERDTNESVVVKAVKKGDHNVNAIERLRHESTFNFECKGLPKILELYESESEIVLIRKLIEGQPICSITDSLKRKKRLPFVIQFLEAYNEIDVKLKKEQIVHADIKPGNILVQNKADDMGVNLIDFGLAIRLNETEKRKTLFPLGYAAPELLLNQLDLVDHRTDQFALGIMLWRIFCGQIPLTHPNPSIMTNLQLTHPLPDHIDLPKGVYNILERMCTKHQFKTPPNKMNIDVVREHLKSAMNSRYCDLDEIIYEFKSIPTRKFFYQKRSLR